MKTKLYFTTTFALIVALTVGGCETVNTTLQDINAGLEETNQTLKGEKPYRYESVKGEPDQRLIIIKSMSTKRRVKYEAEAIAGACPTGQIPDVLGKKDSPDKYHYKIVVWCQ